MKSKYFAVLLVIDLCTSSPLHSKLETDKKLSAEESSVEKIKEPPDLKKSVFNESTTTSSPLDLKQETGSAPKPEQSTTPISEENGGSDETGDVGEDGEERNKNSSEATASIINNGTAGHIGKNVGKSEKEEVSTTVSSLGGVYSNLPNQFDVSGNLDDDIRHPVKKNRLNSTDHVPWVTFKPSSNEKQKDDVGEDFVDSDASSTQTYVHESESDARDITTEETPVPEMVSSTPPSSHSINESKMEIDNEIVGSSRESKTIDTGTEIPKTTDIPIPVPTVSSKSTVIPPVEKKESSHKSEIKMVDATGKPEVTTVKPADEPEIKTMEPTDKPEIKMVEPKDKPEVETLKPTEKSDIKTVKHTSKPEMKTAEPTDKSVKMAVKPTDKPEIKTVEPIDKPELKKVEPTDKPEINMVEPKVKPEVETLKPTEKSEIKTVEPTDKPEINTAEPTDKSMKMAVKPTDKPEIKTVEPTDKPELKTVEPINKTELKTVNQIFNDIKDITLHNAYAILLLSVAILFIFTWLVGLGTVVFFIYKLLRKCLTGLKNCVHKKDRRVSNENGILDAGSLFYPYQRPVLRPYVPDPGDRVVHFNDRRMFN